MASSSLLTDLQKQLNKNKKEIDMLKNKLETVESDHENLLGNNPNVSPPTLPPQGTVTKINFTDSYSKKVFKFKVENTNVFTLIYGAGGVFYLIIANIGAKVSLKRNNSDFILYLDTDDVAEPAHFKITSDGYLVVSDSDYRIHYIITEYNNGSNILTENKLDLPLYTISFDQSQ